MLSGWFFRCFYFHMSSFNTAWRPRRRNQKPQHILKTMAVSLMGNILLLNIWKKGISLIRRWTWLKLTTHWSRKKSNIEHLSPHILDKYKSTIRIEILPLPYPRKLISISAVVRRILLLKPQVIFCEKEQGHSEWALGNHLHPIPSPISTHFGIISSPHTH